MIDLYKTKYLLELNVREVFLAKKSSGIKFKMVIWAFHLIALRASFYTSLVGGNFRRDKKQIGTRQNFITHSFTN